MDILYVVNLNCCIGQYLEIYIFKIVLPYSTTTMK